MLREEVPDAALRCMLVCLATVSPKPPRVMVLVTAGFGAMAVSAPSWCGRRRWPGRSSCRWRQQTYRWPGWPGFSRRTEVAARSRNHHPSGGPSYNPPSAASRSCRCFAIPPPCRPGPAPAYTALRRIRPRSLHGWRTSAQFFRFFQRVVVGGGALFAHGRIGARAVVGILIQRDGLIALFTAGKHKYGADGQRDRRHTVAAPGLAERLLVDVFGPFHRGKSHLVRAVSPFPSSGVRIGKAGQN